MARRRIPFVNYLDDRIGFLLPTVTVTRIRITRICICICVSEMVLEHHNLSAVRQSPGLFECLCQVSFERVLPRKKFDVM